MSTLTIILIACGISVVAVVAIFLSQQSKQKRSASINLRSSQSGLTTTGEEGRTSSPTEVIKEELPSAIYFGTDVKNPAVTLRPLQLPDMQAIAKVPVVNPSIGVASRVLALMQAAPSLIVANSHAGKQLMEVVIDGPLVRAAESDGFRAMTMGPKGIKEHATLFEAKDVTNLVNAAAVWQLASVIVAQKHMADISQKLTEINEAVKAISEFQDEGRRSVIKGTYKYLSQAYEVLTQGELSQAIRSELEACERKLLTVQDHLVTECQAQARQAPEDTDSFGTESLHRNSMCKYNKLDKIINDLDLCVKTRALNWYVLSLYPGEQSLKVVRRRSIEQGLEEFLGLKQAIDSQSQNDLAKFKAFWNSDDTLETRKTEVASKAKQALSRLTRTDINTKKQLAQTETLLLQRDQPTQLIVELMDGQVTQIRQRELVAAQ